MAISTIINYRADDYEATLTYDPLRCKYTLNWGDYVANEWTEEYVLLSDALTRLALLQACAESDFELAFSDSTPEQHSASCQAMRSTLVG